jgi:hypothetical protein
VFQEEMPIAWEAMVSVFPIKEVNMYICPIPNGYRDRDISPDSFKIGDKKEILRTLSDTGIYCSSDKVGTVYQV